VRLLARKPSHIAHDPDDLRRQNRSHAEDLGERGVPERSLHLSTAMRSSSSALSSAPQGAHVSHHSSTARGVCGAGPCRMLGPRARRNNWAAASAESCFLRSSERRSSRRVARADVVQGSRVRSATRSSRRSVSSLKTSSVVALRTVLGLSRGQSRSFRRAASAMRRWHPGGGRSLASVAARESTPTREEESLGGTSTTLSPAARSKELLC
jgi:hypothetical protein